MDWWPFVNNVLGLIFTAAVIVAGVYTSRRLKQPAAKRRRVLDESERQ